MDHFNRFRQYLAINTFAAIFLPGLAGIGLFICLRELLDLELALAVAASALLYIGGAALSYHGLMRTSTGPLKMVWQAIWHVSPGKSDVPPPKPDQIKIKTARELVSAMVMQVYDLASSKPAVPAENNAANAAPVSVPASQAKPDAGSLLEGIPLPLFVLDKEWNIKLANQAAMAYLDLSNDKVIGKNIYDTLRLSFKTEDTLDAWLKITDSKATDTRSWEHIRLTTADGQIKQLDMAARYVRDHPGGNEVVLALFDRTDAYSHDDASTNYVAVAVHELRTPLTLLRGYVEMFEEELGPNLSHEHQEFMRKMGASAQSLTTFVNNILNTARIDENQFVVSLREADWSETLRDIIKDLELRAQVRGKKIELKIDEGLPAVAIDRVAVYEVVNNLVENAIKYSAQSTDITISAILGKDGMVETTVEDRGVGIPESVIGELFTKFYRSHRSKNAVGGNGLGLYLVKTIVMAHGGNVWVTSKEGEGSRFSFTLQPFERVKDSSPNSDGLEHQAGGWIKNHSLYRR